MKAPSAAITSVVMAGSIMAYPGLKNTLHEIEARLEPRQSTSLIGDLQNLPESNLTPTGSAVKQILTGEENGQDLWSRYRSVPARDSPECSQDTCCIWKHIADEMRASMVGTAGRCNKLARGAVRLGFHDAGAWSQRTGPTGGADGSVVLAGECEDRKENQGLESTCDQIRTWYDKYKQYGISMADLIQMGATVGTVVCPLGPRVRTFIGRKDNPDAAPTGNLPSPFASADDIITMFADKTISAQGLVALLGAHTASQQSHVYANQTGAPQEPTPGVWDTAYFRETMADHCPERMVRFVSDTNLAADERTRRFFSMYGGWLTGQHAWNEAYAREYVRLSLLGVDNINDLTECTKALPPFMGSTFYSPDEAKMARFMDGELDYAAEPLMMGDVIPDE